jgi:hypothetical protein
MSVQNRNLFGAGVPNGSSGNGASAQGPTDPNTGEKLPGYKAPQPSSRLSTSHGLDSQLSRDRYAENEGAFKAAQARFTGEKCQGSYGMGTGGATDSRFDRTGNPPSGPGAFGTTTGGTDELVLRKGSADDPFVWPYGAGGTSIA